MQKYASKLPVGTDPAARKAQKDLFSWFDVSGNGSLSLSEIELGIKSYVGEEVFMMKRAIKMAFKMSRGSDPNDKDSLAVELPEFRELLLNMRIYMELYVMFDELDESNDHRIEFSEFCQGLEKIKKWGLEVEDPEAEFKKIDDNGGGYILFDEFCAWALEKDLDYDPLFGVDEEEIAKRKAEQINSIKTTDEKQRRGPSKKAMKRKECRALPAFLSIVYSEKDPSKLPSIPKMMNKYKGNEVTLLRNVVGKYGVPQQHIPRDFRKYTRTVKRKAQQALNVHDLLEQLRDMKEKHEQVQMDLQHNNRFLEQELQRQQRELDKSNRIIEEQQKEIKQMFQIVEDFVKRNPSQTPPRKDTDMSDYGGMEFEEGSSQAKAPRKFSDPRATRKRSDFRRDPRKISIRSTKRRPGNRSRLNSYHQSRVVE